MQVQAWAQLVQLQAWQEAHAALTQEVDAALTQEADAALTQ